MWILTAQIYWLDILRLRKYGRRLVYALLNHLSTVSLFPTSMVSRAASNPISTQIHRDPDKDILIQLSSQIATLLNSLIKHNPDNFIYPSVWPKHREAFRAFLQADDKTAHSAYEQINLRNGRLLVANTASPPAGRQHLVRLLDSALRNSVVQDLSVKCWATNDDKFEIVKTTVEWATSFHRPGLAKVYIAANLLRSWSTYRVNVTQAILENLDSISSADEVRKQMAYRLVTELVRTGHFSVAQYTKWLMARGNCHDASEVDSDEAPCASRLLVNLPLHCLSEIQKRDRGNMLRRAANYSVAEEADDIHNALKCTNSTLGLPLHTNDTISSRKPMPIRKLLRLITNSSKALQSCIGAHLRDIVVLQPPPKFGLNMSSTMFSSIRSILETTQDFSMLSEILKACSRTSSVDVLASCVDTINLNLEIFYAMGSADDLFNMYIDRLKAISQEMGLITRSFLAALSCLAQRMHHREAIAKQLLQELAQRDRSIAIDACSPVSDNMVGQAQGADGEVSEQIDKLLASGNSIDHPTLNRLFRYIVPRLESGWLKMNDSRRAYASLLTRLRIFDSQHFDKLMADWVSHVRMLKDRQRLSALFPLLVSGDCLSISTLLQTANASPQVPRSAASSDQGHILTGSATYLQELLQLILMKLPAETDLGPEEEYRFRIHQQASRSDHHKGLLMLIRNAIIEYSGLQNHHGASPLPLDDPECRQSVIESLRLLVVADSATVAEALSAKNLTPEAANLIHGMVNKLLMSDAENQSQSFDQILALANELTLPFCQIKLNLDLSVSQARAAGAEDQSPSQLDMFAKAMDRAIEAQNIMWTSMLPCLSEDITQRLKCQTHMRFLELLPSPRPLNMDATATSENSIRLAKNLLGVAESIISGQPPPKSAQLSGALVEKLSGLCELVAVKDEAKASTQAAVLNHWLPALLRFITLQSISAEPIHTAGPPISGKPAFPANHEARARILLTLCGLLLEFDTQPNAQPLKQQVFDVAALLADGLPDELRTHCARSILLLPGSSPSINTSSDPRLYYLLSTSQPTAADNLMLAHRDKSSMPHSAAARGMSAMYGIGPASQERLSPFVLRRWEVLSEPTPNMGENDTSLSLGLFEAIKIQ